MNARQLIKLGVPEDCVKAAILCIQKCAKDKMPGNLIKKTIQACVEDPEKLKTTVLFGDFCKALIADKAFVRKEAISYKAWGEVELASHNQMLQACSIPSAVAAAVMPDSHPGFGICIGGVLALDNAICPFAVGVDIACFTGDTKIPLLDGKNYSLKELAEKQSSFLVYACKPDGKVVITPAIAFKTKENQSLVKIVLDNGAEIRCTSDEEFMLRDGTFAQARDLSPNTSLMPFNSQLDKEGYTRIQQNYSGRWQRAHWIVARCGLLGKIPKLNEQRIIIHHKNFNKSDNLLDNLEFMGNSDHATLHRSIVEKNEHWQSEEFEKRRIEALSNKAATPEGYAYFAERGSKNFKKYWLEDYERAKDNCAGNGERGKPFLIAKNQSPNGRARSRELANKEYPCEICGEGIKSYIGLYNHKRVKHGLYPFHTTRKKENHKVVAVIPLIEREDVYCLNVPNYENFAIQAGVFVHNCRMKMSILDMPVDTVENKFNLYKEAIEQGTVFGVGQVWKPRKHHHVMDEDWNITPVTREYKDRAWDQLGTSGSGNHFCDVGILKVYEDSILPVREYVAIMTHSGSRGTGGKVCDVYSGIAQARLPIKYKDLGKLAWLDMDTEAGNEYLLAMQLMGRYAAANHDLIHRHIIKLLGAEVLEQVENHHNFAWEEEHFGKKLIVHRKGATPAGKGVLGVIPGSMGTPAYVVRGLGNIDSLCSASHGAGRKMSRREANQKFSWQAVCGDLEKKGIIVLSAGADESPGSYKDIDEVMAQQVDLVEPIAKFYPKIVKMCGTGDKAED
jgi:tRNA-splicing ligase RtcB